MVSTSQHSARVLIVDDDPDVVFAASLLLKRHFASVQTLSDPRTLPELTQNRAFDVLLLDMNFTATGDTGAEGLRWLSEVRAVDPEAVVIFITAHADIPLAVEAIRHGAADFVVKPWENDRLVTTTLAAANLKFSRIEVAELRHRNRGLAAATQIDHEMIGSSLPMRRLLELIRRTAPTRVNVLVLGENGTGKELVAREIHRLSARASEAFVRVDLGSIAGGLFESELFGHRRGAFTDSKEHRVGRFRAATGGTLFLDEIGNVPVHLQSKLLAVIEHGEFFPVGSDRPESIDVRLICATNLSRYQLRDESQFRPDLLHRINTVEIVLPSLRQRPDDIPLLTEHFIAYYAQKYNFPRKRLTAGALEHLMTYSWPGNVRELRHAIERATILSAGTTLELEDFMVTSEGSGAPATACDSPLDLNTAERSTIARALRRCGGNVSRAAAVLGLTRASLYRRMQKYDL